MRLYDNSRTVSDEAAILADFQQRSLQAYTHHPHSSHAYGVHPRQQYDVFACGAVGAPILVFIHGGYWQWCDKSDFGFIVNAPLAAGFDVILLEYPLTPETCFAEVVNSVGVALDFLSNKPEFKNRQVYLSGHSAGGHLSAYWQRHPWIHNVCAISGLYDLEPIRHTHLNEALNLSCEDVQDFSPIHFPAIKKPLYLVYGGQELVELQWQSTKYAHELSEHSNHAKLQELSECNHYSILDAVFGEQGYWLTQVAAAHAQ
ncbi:alpha/beta hydrolase [Vitreoscilla massiliensis]|uniref:Alpha/beta hydrolase n=1 Tax=Vitreoscilla massiliensis TaxID=1689272 RepID=A0ABY4DZH8_9NEIS|nr:alpha/beta hydrolase [Vitreoscilla massiliensis]UOO88535.1 alpha/beta hydrolase [Vitreoscilla massiliensis]